MLKKFSLLRSAWLAVFVLSALLALNVPVFGQNNGSIDGVVKDPSGGLVPAAEVTIVNAASGIPTKTTTNESGAFVFPLLPVGTYSLMIEKPGFKKLETENVILSATGKLNLGDVILQVGGATETVTVEAELGRLQVQSESGERSSVLTNRQIRDIALNGRNVVDLMRTIPGVISGGVTANAASTVTNIVGGFNINGTRSTQHEYTIDGVTNLNLGNNTGGLVSVNPDALDEVKVLTSNYQAEYGRAGGGFIALTTRSGTNDFHGGARYFRRHDSMNADPYFNNLRGGSANGFPRPLYRYNFYGWDFGGPVLIPHIVNGKNKLFFFISQEYYSQLVPQAASMNIRVPTAAERTGNFSQSVDGSGKPITIIDPTTLQPFAGNIIPTARLYGPGSAILNFLPSPNTTAGGNVYNYSSQIPSSYPRRENILRVDYQIAPSTKLSARWIYNHDDQQFAYGTSTASWNWPLTTTDRKNGPGNVPTITLTHSFGPTWINEFTFGVGLGGVTIAPSDDKATRSVTGINTPLLYPTANTSGLIPSLSFGGIASVSSPVNTSVFGIFSQNFRIYQVMDNVTKVVGKTLVKFGIYYQSAANESNSQTHVESDLDFSANGSNPLNTGYSFANALLGVYNTYTQASSKPVASYLYHDVSFFVQDTWKVHPRLTLDLGLRFSWYQPLFNADGPSSYFNPALFNPSTAPRIYRPICVGASTCSAGAATYRAIDPSVAGAATLSNTQPGYYVGKLVNGSGNLTDGLISTADGYPASGTKSQTYLPQPRFGFAWDVAGNQKTVVRGGFGVTFDRPRSDVTGFGATNPPYVYTPSLQYGYLQDITPGGAGLLSPLAITGVSESSKYTSIYSYSIGVQRSIGVGTVVDVSYVGSQSRHLPRKFNLNAPALGTAFKAAAQDPTKFAGGVIPATDPALPAAYAAAGVSFAGDKILPSTDFLRPYQGFSDITYTNFDGNATYNSLQISAHRRFSKGVTFGVSYTLSKATTTVSDEGTFTNNVNPRAYDYGLAAFDRTHYFTGNFVWDLPKGSAIMHGNKAARLILDGWTISGFTTVFTGNPLDLGLSISGQDAGTRLLGSPTAGNLSGQQPRFFLNGDPQSGSTINLSAFVVPGIGASGPYPRYYLRNPGAANQDLSVFKNFPMGGDGKRYLQLRAEAFNVLNHPQFSGYNLTTNVTNATGATGSAIFNNFTGLTVTNNLRPAGSASVLGTYFGEFNGARDMRIIQLAAKFYF